MRINVRNFDNLAIEKTLTQFQSLQWETDFNNGDGMFQLDCDISYLNSIKDKSIIENTEDDTLMIVTNIETKKELTKYYLTVKGSTLAKYLLNTRVIKGIYEYLNMESVLIAYNLIDLNLFNPFEIERKSSLIGNIVMPEQIEATFVDSSSKYEKLGDEVYNLIRDTNVGLKAVMNYEINKIDLIFYSGQDHTFGSENPVILSSTWGTIRESSHLIDSTSQINTLYVLGQDGVIVTVSQNNNEVIIEKSIDLSNEVPWPTYRIEHPNETGGQYYRYTKNPEIISNMDVWNRFAVQYNPTYNENPIWASTKVLTESQFKALKATFYANVTIDLEQGFVLSGICFNNIIEAAKNTLKASSAETEIVLCYSVSDMSSVITSSISGSQHSIIVSEDGIVEKYVLKKTNEGFNVNVFTGTLQQNTSTEPTYEVLNFVDYVYVNKGDAPTQATKIVQGTVESGDVYYYENFEEKKVSSQVYRDLLKKKGKEYLKIFQLAETVSVVPDNLGNKKFKSEYNLGDVITYKDDTNGFEQDFRVSKAVEVWDSEGYNLHLSLGTNVPSLTERIKLITKGG